MLDTSTNTSAITYFKILTKERKVRGARGEKPYNLILEGQYIPCTNIMQNSFCYTYMYIQHLCQISFLLSHKYAFILFTHIQMHSLASNSSHLQSYLGISRSAKGECASWVHLHVYTSSK